MKVFRRWLGETVLSLSELAGYDKAARRRLANAKRAKAIRVSDNVVHLRVAVRCTLPNEMQMLLRDLANIRKHGKAYAPEEADPSFQDVHARISRSREFLLPVKFDLDTGDVTLDWPT